jgi:hypothetical protein
MPDPSVLEVGQLADIDGAHIDIGVDYDTVTVAGYRFDADGCEEFAKLFVRACWMAGVNAERMRSDA